MLRITHDAAQLLTLARASAGAPESFGVRFYVEKDDPGKAALALAFVERPEPQDEVGEESGLSVYVAPEVSQAVGGSTLTVDAAGAGNDQRLVVRAEGGAPGHDGHSHDGHSHG